MADLDNFFAKKDKKKKGKTGGFSKANNLAKNLEETERKEAKAEEKASPLATSEATKLAFEDNPIPGVTGHRVVDNEAEAAEARLNIGVSVLKYTSITAFCTQ